MHRLINYAEKYSLKFFLKLLTVRLLRIVNEYHSNNRSLLSDSKLILMTGFFMIENCAWKGKVMDSIKLLVSVMAWFGIWLVIFARETG